MAGDDWERTRKDPVHADAGADDHAGAPAVDERDTECMLYTPHTDFRHTGTRAHTAHTSTPPAAPETHRRPTAAPHLCLAFTKGAGYWYLAPMVTWKVGRPPGELQLVLS